MKNRCILFIAMAIVWAFVLAERSVQKSPEISTLRSRKTLTIQNEEINENKISSSFSNVGSSTSIKTATGGFIRKVLIFFTIVAFVGNAAFMINVFWLTK
jgi:hypothetical protein